MGAAGRSNIQTLIDMKAISLAEAKQRCPNLAVRPMRTTRYREVAEQIQASKAIRAIVLSEKREERERERERETHTHRDRHRDRRPSRC